MATKLHEILAVEGDLDATQKKIAEETKTTFEKKADHFIEGHRELAMFNEDDAQQNQVEHKAMVTTVIDKLEWTAQAAAKYYDTVFAKDRANQSARADIAIDGTVLAKDVPATFLLGLETKLKALRDVYLAIPTLAPGHAWEPDATRGKGVYRARDPEIRMKTAKTIRYKVLVEPTKEHPAQIEKWFEDVPVGKVTNQVWSGMLSPAEKSDMIGRIDQLLRAVKRARQRANMVDVGKSRIGGNIFAFIHEGKLPQSEPTGSASSSS